MLGILENRLKQNDTEIQDTKMCEIQWTQCLKGYLFNSKYIENHKRLNQWRANKTLASRRNEIIYLKVKIIKIESRQKRKPMKL